MFIKNSSSISKTLRIKKTSFIFPPGISEHPELAQIVNYAGKHKDLSVIEKPEQKIKIKTVAKPVVDQKETEEVNLDGKRKYNKKSKKTESTPLFTEE